MLYYLLFEKSLFFHTSLTSILFRFLSSLLLLTGYIWIFQNTQNKLLTLEGILETQLQILQDKTINDISILLLQNKIHRKYC